MAHGTDTLDALRRRVDDLDDQLHDLLIRRTALVQEIGQMKRNGNVPPLRPGREALILRRLVARHRGPFPKAALVRMWREMLAAQVRLQGTFTVAVWVPNAAPGCWDLARDHYGSTTAMTPYRSVGQVVRAVGDGQASLGVVPLPQEAEADPWWPLLCSGEAAPRVIARLPFAPTGQTRGGPPSALAIALSLPEPTGRDCSLVVLESSGGASRARINAIVGASGLNATFLAAQQREDGKSLSLFEVDEAIPSQDPRLGDLAQRLGGGAARAIPIGFYARPLTASELETPPATVAS